MQIGPNQECAASFGCASYNRAERFRLDFISVQLRTARCSVCTHPEIEIARNSGAVRTRHTNRDVFMIYFGKQAKQPSQSTVYCTQKKERPLFRYSADFLMPQSSGRVVVSQQGHFQT